jgi:hypothetical protein
MKRLEITESTEVNVSDLPVGIYFLQVKTGGKQVTQKLVKY